MRLLIATDEHYINDGSRTLSEDGATPYTYWQEYLQAFEKVLVFARVRRDQSFKGAHSAVSIGRGVEFIEIPYFRGPLQYLRMRPVVSALARQAVTQAEAFLLRVPGMIGTALSTVLRRSGRPYAAQVVGDPWEAFGAGRAGGAFRPFYRLIMTRDLKRVCSGAEAIWYVTQRTLQRRYPPSKSAFVSSWSDVQMQKALASEEQLEARIKSLTLLGTRQKILGWVGSLQQPYKRADILLKAVAICRRRGLDLKVRFAGGGRLQGQYEELAAKLGIAEQVEFLGQIGAGPPIYAFLDSVDLFVMPSPVEGLPRAMIEAMARGCPCIGSNAGGIPELLDEDGLVKPVDYVALADKIIEKLERPDALGAMARRNLKEAQKYTPGRTAAARREFLAAIRDRAQCSRLAQSSTAMAQEVTEG